MDSNVTRSTRIATSSRGTSRQGFHNNDIFKLTHCIVLLLLYHNCLFNAQQNIKYIYAYVLQNIWYYKANEHCQGYKMIKCIKCK